MQGQFLVGRNQSQPILLYCTEIYPKFKVSPLARSLGQKRGPYIRAALYLNAELIHKCGGRRTRINIFVRIFMY